ncbi:N-acetyltransferase [Marinitoga lauensis]|uniref:N-acetyltransferase n=1 Tax=Marinitoga lauensis TaxID=2201189 RepID=UPI00197D7AD7|nr:N-acetyltransferase [Marinitoga lauensis]
MWKEIPEKVSQEQITFDVRELEPILSGPSLKLPPYEPEMAKLKDGSYLYIRPLEKDEVPKLLPFIKKLLDVDHDFYDIVGVRVYGELLGWYRNRLKDPYFMIGTINGKLAGFANARVMNNGIHISLHSMAFVRGLRVGAIMYYAKAKYAFEKLGAKEWWQHMKVITDLRDGFRYGTTIIPWPDVQHELGGAKVYYVTKEYWDLSIKDYLKQLVKTELEPASAEVAEANKELIIPDSPVV